MAANKDKRETTTQKIVRVTTETAVAGTKAAWRNAILLVFALIFGGLLLAILLGPASPGKNFVIVGGLLALLIAILVRRSANGTVQVWRNGEWVEEPRNK